MLSTVFSMITGIVGLWGLWTVRPIISSSVAISYTEFTRSPSAALVGAPNLGRTNVPLPSCSVTNLPHRKSRKARRRNSPKYACFNFSFDIYISCTRSSCGWVNVFALAVHVCKEYTIYHDPYLPSS
jgi:hypothetical protein